VSQKIKILLNIVILLYGIMLQFKYKDREARKAAKEQKKQLEEK